MSEENIRDVYRSQVGRLASLGNLPSTTEGKGALVNALMRFTPEQARQIVDHVVNGGKIGPAFPCVPQPWQLMIIGLGLFPPKGTEAPRACSSCHGTGYRSVTKVVTKGVFVGETYEEAERCDHGRV